jgi:hypothetical protein
MAILSLPAPPPARSRNLWIVLALCAWLLLVLGAMAELWKYKSSAGGATDAPHSFPSTSRIAHEAGVPALIMFAHPMCSCTRASLAELRVLMSEFRGKIDATVVFLTPGAGDDAWSTSDSLGLARSIDGVHVAQDVEGRESVAFGARTSGAVVLYDTEGQLLFSGGITSARGHVGDNSGVEQIRKLLRGQTREAAGAPVFGCALRDSE